MRLFSLLLISSATFVFQSLYAQEGLDSLVSDLRERSGKYPTELIYLQTSKDIYETGEDLWFKAYQLDASTLTLSNLSQTLYLQVICQADSTIVWQEKYPINNGIADGQIYLDKNLKEGNYFLEAYTSNSFCRDSCGLFSVRKIKVVDNIAGDQSQMTNDLHTVLRFEIYPEGGHLVDGIPSRLAFKATDGRGNPLDVVGTLYENEKPLVTFESTHDGMGAFELTPSINRTYKIRLDNGQTCSLPQIHTKGITLSMTEQDNEFIEFTINQSAGLPAQSIYLLGQMRGVPYCGAKAVIQDSLKIRLPLKNFVGQGIVEFTLFDKEMQPIAERLAFIRLDQKLYISAKTDETTYMVRNKVKLKLKVTDEMGNPVIAHLGVSVFDKAYAEQAYPVNIQTHCLLSSQIRGKIHNPYYYFNKENANRNEAFNLLLMTQGWRNYVWQYNNQQEIGNKVLTDELKGIQTIKNKKMRGTEQMIQVSGADKTAAFVWIDSLGHFAVQPDLLNQLRGGYIYLKPMLTKDYGVKLELEDPFSTINNTRKQKKRYYPFIDTSRVKQESKDREPLINQFGTVLLNEVTVTAKTNRPFRDKFMGSLDSLAQMNLGPWVCDHGFLEDYKEGYTHHHNPQYCPCPQSTKRHIPIIGKSYDILKSKYFPCQGSYPVFISEDYQSIIYEGAIYTDEELLKMNNLWRAKGYYGVKEFYQPDQIEILFSLPDVRNTLLWAPSVVTDEKGEASLSFYCSDINTRFVGRIEGISDSGLLGTTECEFSVIRAGQKK